MLNSRSFLLPGMLIYKDVVADESAGTADVRQVFEQAKNGLKLTGRYVPLCRLARLIRRMTILMIDEIHR